MQSMAAAAIDQVVATVLRITCRLLESSRKAPAIKALLLVLHYALYFTGPLPDVAAWAPAFEHNQQNDGDADQLAMCQSQLQRHISVSDKFYLPLAALWHNLQQAADVLLSVIACDWRPAFSLKEHKQLFDVFFDSAPAPLALHVLTGHISQVVPADHAAWTARSNSFVHVAGSETAAELLAQRFAVGGSSGLQQLVVCLTLHDACSACPPSESQISREQDGLPVWSSSGSATPNTQDAAVEALLPAFLSLPAAPIPPAISGTRLGGSSAWSACKTLTNVDHVIALLVALPDRAAHLPGRQDLQHESFYMHLIQQLLEVLADPATAFGAAARGLVPVQVWDSAGSRAPQARQASEAAGSTAGEAAACSSPAAAGPMSADTTPSPGGADTSAQVVPGWTPELHLGEKGGMATPGAGTLRVPDPPPSLVPAIQATALQLLSTLVARLCKRGHACIAATALLWATAQGERMLLGRADVGDAIAQHHDGSSTTGCPADDNTTAAAGGMMGSIHNVLASLLQQPGSAPAEKLLEALLLQAPATVPPGAAAPAMASSAVGSANGDMAPPGAALTAGSAQRGDLPTPHPSTPTTLDGGAGGGGHTSAIKPAHHLPYLLPRLLGPRVLASAELQYILVDRFLLRRTLPSPALDLLVQLLACGVTAAEPTGSPHNQTSGKRTSDGSTSSGDGSGTGRGSLHSGVESGGAGDMALVAAAAVALARVWGDPTTVTRSPIPQQAYQAAALVRLLPHLDRAGLEGTRGLLPALLEGVSARLGSPLPSIRHQAMRVGRAFSAVLDPACALFEEQGALPLAVEELWPGAPRREAAGVAAEPARCQRICEQAKASAAAKGLALAGAEMRAPTSGRRQAPVETDAPLLGSNRMARVRLAEKDLGRPSTAIALDAAANAAAATAAVGLGLPDSDDPDSDDEEGEGLQPYDVAEDLAAEKWETAGSDTLQLRALAAGLRKHDDATAVLDALCRAEPLLRAAPDELALAAPELARSLLYCRVPEWAVEEANSLEERPDVRRFRALAALAAIAPVQGGETLVRELYSPHLDTHQRTTLLDSLSAAAMELADPSTAPCLEISPAGAPRLVLQRGAQLPRPQLTAAAADSGSGVASGHQPDGVNSGRGGRAAIEDGVRQAGAEGAGHALAPSKTRVWGHSSLRRQALPPCKAHRNRFADVALQWASGLLRGIDVVRQGVDLLGRDSLTLGCLLSALSTFVECAAATPVALPMAVATLELLQSPQVHRHAEPFVRRAALLAAGQVLGAVPPAGLAGALMGQEDDAQDALLVGRLEWLQQWLAQVRQQDVDESCRLMASTCATLQGGLATSAMKSLQAAAGASAQHILGVAGVTGLGGAGDPKHLDVSPGLNVRSRGGSRDSHGSAVAGSVWAGAALRGGGVGTSGWGLQGLLPSRHAAGSATNAAASAGQSHGILLPFPSSLVGTRL